MTDSTKQRFHQVLPEVFFLSLTEAEALNSYLKSSERLSVGEQVLRLEKPGDGNMNCVIRVITNLRSFILKQSRPWVEKYPQINAPIERLSVEAAYYQSIGASQLLSTMSPEMLWHDAKNHILALTDLGSASDLTPLYHSEMEMKSGQIDELCTYLGELHGRPVDQNFPDNMSMRRLNHEHIFDLPFKPDNGLDLDQFTSGLNAVAKVILTDSALVRRIQDTGSAYLDRGKHLIHGDFYPGSWLKLEGAIKVIDPEFCFIGPREFDLGVMIAHLWMAQQPSSLIGRIRERYQDWHLADPYAISAFAGIEIMRRLLGVAQLPLRIDLSVKENLLKQAVAWVKGKDHPF